MAILKQAANGVPGPALCREHGMSSASFYKWRARFGGTNTSKIKRMRELEDESRRLRIYTPNNGSKLSWARKLVSAFDTSSKFYFMVNCVGDPGAVEVENKGVVESLKSSIRKSVSTG